MKTLLLALLLSATTSVAAPQSLSDIAWFRKISLHLRGHEPSAAEYADFKQARAQNRAREWVLTKTDEMLGSEAYARQMTLRMMEHFRLGLVSEFGGALDRLPFDASSEKCHRQAERNLPWDDLWLDSVYRTNLRPGDDAPYATMGVKPIADLVSFPRGDDRVAGLITTRKFIDRYQNSSLNKSRRRAAAIFRIFLCDDMMPVIPPEGGGRDERLDDAFPDQADPHVRELLEELARSNNDVHGRQPACMSCHSKLDPMGRTFQGVGMALHPRPFKGQLVFKGDDGRQVNEPVSGLGSLMAALVRQPEYRSCQVRFFWKEFVGQDYPLDGKTLNELGNGFDAVGRRTNDFVRLLVQRPEFRTNPDTLPVTWESIQPHLKRCDTCHTVMGHIPDFGTSATIGFSGSKEEHKQWIEAMHDRLNRPDGDPKKMPRKAGEWNPEVLQAIKKWVAQERSQP